MDYHKYFEQLREKHLKLKRDLDDCVQNHANNIATIYINKLIDNIEKKNEDFVKNGSIETMIDKCTSNCDDFLSHLIDKKVRDKLPEGVQIYKKVYNRYSCKAYNPGFLGLYNLYTKDNSCDSYNEFSYLIKFKSSD